MKKYLIFSLIFTLFLSSCSNKKEEEYISKDEKIENIEININSWVEEVNSWKIEDIETKNEKDEDTSITEVDWLIIYKNLKNKYKISFKKTENLIVEEKFNWEIFIANNETKNILSVVTQKYLEIEEIKTFDEYVDWAIEDIKKVVEIKDLKKEKISLKNIKGYKVTYLVDDNQFSQYIFDRENTAFIIIKAISDTKTEKEIQDIVDSFEFLD